MCSRRQSLERRAGEGGGRQLKEWTSYLQNKVYCEICEPLHAKKAKKASYRTIKQVIMTTLIGRRFHVGSCTVEVVDRKIHVMSVLGSLALMHNWVGLLGNLCYFLCLQVACHRL